MHTRELLLKIMFVPAKVGTLREQLPSVLVDPCLYYCCTVHQALAALRSLCTEGCARIVKSTCVGVRNVICEFIWTAATLLCVQVRTGLFDAYCTYVCMYMYAFQKSHLNPMGFELFLLMISALLFILRVSIM